MGIFASPTPSIFLQQVFNGPTAMVLSDQVCALFGQATRQLAQAQLHHDPDEDGDIIDLG